MKRIHLIGILFLGVFLCSYPCQAIDITISSPIQGATVDQRQDVSGHVSDASTNVVIVVHPVTVSEFWVQPPVSVGNNGQWKVKAYFGRQGMDQGVEYEIRAFANPRPPVQEGKYSTWPTSIARSDVVTVKRR